MLKFSTVNLCPHPLFAEASTPLQQAEISTVHQSVLHFPLIFIRLLGKILCVFNTGPVGGLKTGMWASGIIYNYIS